MFERMAGEWSNERLVNEYAAMRLADRAAISVPCEDPVVHAFAPFGSAGYTHARRLGSLDSEPWKTIVSGGVDMRLDPFAASAAREGRAIWDAAVALPACSIRSGRIARPRDIAPANPVNQAWGRTLAQSMAPMEGRPHGPFVYDFTTADDGWYLMELAHALAHASCSSESEAQPPDPFDYFHLSQRFAWFAAAIAVGEMLGTPIPTSYRGDFPGLGLGLSACPVPEAPWLTVPWDGTGAPVPDETLGIVAAGVYFEPVPAEYLSGSMRVRTSDRWCCMPTVVTLGGWAHIDRVCHCALSSETPWGSGGEICYAMHMLDLLPPESLGAYFRLWQMETGRSSPGCPPSHGLFSSAFADLVARTPPMPCKSCMCWNRRTADAPVRPSGRSRPKTPKELKESRFWDWKLYTDAVDAIHRLLQRDVMEYEKLLMGEGAGKVRRMRMRNWRQTLAGFKSDRVAAKALVKIRNGRDDCLTKTEREALDRWKAKNRQ